MVTLVGRNGCDILAHDEAIACLIEVAMRPDTRDHPYDYAEPHIKMHVAVLVKWNSLTVIRDERRACTVFVRSQAPPYELGDAGSIISLAAFLLKVDAENTLNSPWG